METYEAFETVLEQLVIKTEEAALAKARVQQLGAELDEATHVRVAQARNEGRAERSQATLELVDAMARGDKIDAIKAFRSLTGYGLKEAKDQVERVMNRTPAVPA